MDKERRFTLAELARVTEIPVRTIRYYIQEGLIDGPEGRGRGRHFGERHLLQLRRTRLLQAAGFDLKSIKDEGVNTQALLENLYDQGLSQIESMKVSLRDIIREKGLQRSQDEAQKEAASEMRIPMVDGVALMVREGETMPSPKDLLEIAMLIQKHFKR